ncbi:MAG: NAD(P)-binding protein, partial [Candidatus Binatia bacterium]
MDSTFDAIVIGSGPGGSSCATLLQKRGLKTLLVEKNNVVGGKMVSVEKDGYAYDLFPHGQVPMRGSAFETIFAELGVSEDFQPALEPDDSRDVITLCYRRKDWKEYKKVSQGQAMSDASPFFKLWEIDEEDQAKVVAIMTEMATMSDEEIAKTDSLSMKEWLAQRDVPYALYSYLAFHANASLAEPIDL